MSPPASGTVSGNGTSSRPRDRPRGAATAEAGRGGGAAGGGGGGGGGTSIRRYLPTSLALKRLVDAGTLGPIYHARATWLRRDGIPGFGRWFTTKTLSGGGALIDVGVHILDLALHMMGYPEPVAVSGSTYAQFGPRRKGLMSYGGPIDD